MNKYPNVAVKILFRYKDRVLMLKHKNGARDFPGGRIEWGESILEALKRELKEELNLVLEKDPELFDAWNYISKNKKRHSVFIYYIYLSDKKPQLISAEGARVLWLRKKDMRDIINDPEFVEKLFFYNKKEYI